MQLVHTEAITASSQETGHYPDRYTWTVTLADEPACRSYARVTITNAHGDSGGACPRHAVAALEGISRARVDWADSKGLNQWERLALELAEEQSQLGYHTGQDYHPAGIYQSACVAALPSIIFAMSAAASRSLCGLVETIARTANPSA